MYDDYELHLRRHLAQTSVRLRMYWIHKLAQHCDPLTATTDTLFDFLESGEWSANTRLTVTSSLRVFYTWAVKTGHLTNNPADDLPAVRVPRKRARIASEEIIESALAIACPVDETMLRLGAECGLRVHEIAQLHHDDRDGNWLEIHGKGGKTRNVYASPELAALLTHIETTSMRWGFYFPGRERGHAAPSTVWKHIRKLTGLNTHSLRHRAGTMVYRRTGYDLRLAQEFLGHANPTTTAVYVHIEREQLMRAADATRMAA